MRQRRFPLSEMHCKQGKCHNRGQGRVTQVCSTRDALLKARRLYFGHQTSAAIEMGISPPSEAQVTPTPTEPPPDRAQRKDSPIKTYLLAPLKVDWLIDFELLLLTFSTGIQDAISFPDFHCFASNQCVPYPTVAATRTQRSTWPPRELCSSDLRHIY